MADTTSVKHELTWKVVELGERIMLLLYVPPPLLPSGWLATLVEIVAGDT